MGRTDRTHDERTLLDVESLTDNSGGTADDTLEDVAGLTIGATYVQAEIQALRDAVANDIADLGAKVNALLERLKAST